MTALHCSGKALKPYIISASVAAECDELNLLINLPLFFKDLYIVSTPESVAAAFSNALCIHGIFHAV